MEPIKDQQPGETQPDLISSYHDDIHQIHLEGYELGVRKARNALFLAAGLILLGEVIAYASSGAELEFLPVAIIAAIVGLFIFLALWTKKKPYTAIVIGLIAFIAYILLVAVLNGIVEGAAGVIKAVIGGWLFKIFIFVALIRPLSDAKELQRAKEENKF